MLHAQQAHRQQQLAIDSGAACTRAFRRALELIERISASAPLSTLLHSDPDAFNMFRALLALPSAEISRLKQDPYPSVLDQPAELAALMEQLSLWSTSNPAPSSRTSEHSAESNPSVSEGINFMDDEAEEAEEGEEGSEEEGKEGGLKLNST